MPAVQVLKDAMPGRPAANQQDGARLMELIAELGPVTSFELARRALLPRFEVHAWLACEANAGRLHRDPATGRYAPWCELPWSPINPTGHGGPPL